MVRNSFSWILGVAVTAVVCGNTAAAAPAVLGEQTLADVRLGRTTVVAHAPTAAARLAAPGAPKAIAAIPVPRPNPLRAAGAAAPGSGALVLDDRRLDAIGAGLGLVDFKNPLLLIAGKVARTNAVLNLPALAAGKGVVSFDAPATAPVVIRNDER